MKYSLQQLDKAALIINNVKELDASIIALESLAQKVVEHNIPYTLKVSGDIKKEEKESVLTSDGSLKKPGGEDFESSMFRMFTMSGSREKKADNTLIDITLSDVDMLGLIGILLSSKYAQRETYKDDIRKLGIEI